MHNYGNVLSWYIVFSSKLTDLGHAVSWPKSRRLQWPHFIVPLCYHGCISVYIHNTSCIYTKKHNLLIHPGSAPHWHWEGGAQRIKTRWEKSHQNRFGDATCLDDKACFVFCGFYEWIYVPVCWQAGLVSTCLTVKFPHSLCLAHITRLDEQIMSRKLDRGRVFI